MKKEELLKYLDEWTEAYRVSRYWNKEFENNYQQIVALIKKSKLLEEKT